MNAQEHYAEAERFLAAALTPHRASMEGLDGWRRDDLAAHATAHATLALAAATGTSSASPAQRDKWLDVAS